MRLNSARGCVRTPCACCKWQGRPRRRAGAGRGTWRAAQARPEIRKRRGTSPQTPLRARHIAVVPQQVAGPLSFDPQPAALMITASTWASSNRSIVCRASCTACSSSPACTSRAPQQDCAAGATTSHPSAASTRAVAALTCGKNTRCTQPSNSPTRHRRSPCAGINSGAFPARAPAEAAPPWPATAREAISGGPWPAPASEVRPSDTGAAATGASAAGPDA